MLGYSKAATKALSFFKELAGRANFRGAIVQDGAKVLWVECLASCMCVCCMCV